MKKYLLILTTCLAFTGCAGTVVTIQGINITDLRDVDPLKVIAGAAASLIVHEAGHAIYSELRGHGWELNLAWTGPEIEFMPSREGDVRWSGRSGFLLQNLIGTILNSAQVDYDFVKGYNAFTAFETFSYPVRRRDSGDLVNLDSDVEFGAYAGWSLFNLHKTMEGKNGL